MTPEELNKIYVLASYAESKLDILGDYKIEINDYEGKVSIEFKWYREKAK